MSVPSFPFPGKSDQEICIFTPMPSGELATLQTPAILPESEAGKVAEYVIPMGLFLTTGALPAVATDTSAAAAAMFEM